MKTYLTKIWIASVVLLACGACDDDKDAEPAGSLLPQFWEVMSQGGYWSEDIRFVYEEDGQMHISDKDIVEDYGNIAGCAWNVNDLLMDPFYYDPKTGYIHRYVMFASWEGDPDRFYRYHPNRFWMGPDYYPSENGFTIVPRGSYEFGEQNAMSNVYTNLISVSADEIVMEVPIKSFIHEQWLLDRYGDSVRPLRYYSRLRTTWRRITDPEQLALLESAEPFEEEPSQQ